MAKKKKELNPQAIEKKTFDLDFEKLKDLSENMNKFDFDNDIDTSKNETFYKLAIKELFNEESTETKTEWLNIGEVFSASKLSYMGKYGDVPLVEDFIKVLEKKRVSLKRKGREEIILALQERRQEEREIQKSNILGLNI